MSTAEATAADPDPIVILRSVNGNGETFALEPHSLDRLRATFGGALRPHPRVFIAHETHADHEHVQGAIAPQVVLLLTGLAEDRLKPLGGVTFRDPVTDRDLPRTGD